MRGEDLRGEEKIKAVKPMVQVELRREESRREENGEMREMLLESLSPVKIIICL